MTKREFLPALFGHESVHDGPVRNALTKFLSTLPDDAERCCSQVKGALLVVLCRLYPERYPEYGPVMDNAIIDYYLLRAEGIFAKKPQVKKQQMKQPDDREIREYIDALNQWEE